MDCNSSSDKWGIQGGQCAVTSNTWATISFLRKYSNTNYVICGGSKVLDSSYTSNPLSVSFKDYAVDKVLSAVHDDTTINKGTWTWISNGTTA